MKALILAAGRGERLQPLTNKLAKPAVPFLNIPLVGFPLFYLERAGIREIAVNTHHLPSTVETAVESLKSRKTKILYSHEQPEILASAGGLAQAVQLAGEKGLAPAEDLVYVNGDMVAFFEKPDVIADLLKFHKSEKALATLVLSSFPESKESFGGVYVDDKNRVHVFSRTPLDRSDLRGWHFTGLMVVNRKIWEGLEAKPANILYDVIQPTIEAGGKVQAMIVPGLQTFETGNPVDFLASTGKALELLSKPSAAQRTMIQILDRYTPGWWKGWRFKPGDHLLCASPGPELLRVKDFAVVSAETVMGRQVCLERSAVIGASVLHDNVDLKDRLIFEEELRGS